MKNPMITLFKVVILADGGEAFSQVGCFYFGTAEKAQEYADSMARQLCKAFAKQGVEIPENLAKVSKFQIKRDLVVEVRAGLFMLVEG